MIETAAVIYVGFFVVAVLYYVYFSIVLPTIIMDLKFRLYAIRDQLRSLKIQGGEVSDHIFHQQQEIINNAINIVSIYDIGFVFFVRQTVNRDTDLKQEIQAKEKILAKARRKNTSLDKINKEVFSILLKALIYNSLPFLIVAFPIYWIVKQLLRLASFSHRRWIVSSTFLTEDEFEDVVPRSLRVRRTGY